MVISVGDWLRLAWQTMLTVGLLVVVGSALLLLRASARDRLGVTSIVVALIPLVIVLLVSLTRRRMVSNHEVARFKLTHADAALLSRPGDANETHALIAGPAAIISSQHELELVQGLVRVPVAVRGVAVTFLASRWGSIVGICLNDGHTTLRKRAFGHIKALPTVDGPEL